MIISHLICIFCLLIFGETKKILTIAGHDAKSHFGSMMFTLSTLADAGHEITVLRTTSWTNWEPLSSKFRHVDLYMAKSSKTPADLFWKIRTVGMNLVFPMLGEDAVATEIVEEHRERLLELMSEEWDLVLVDIIFTPLGFAIADKLKSERNIPYAFFSTSIMFFNDYVRMGLGRNPVSRMTSLPAQPTEPYKPYDPTSFLERLENLRGTTAQWITVSLWAVWKEKCHLALTGHYADFPKLYAESEGILFEDLHFFGYPMPDVPWFSRIGYHCSTEQPSLPQEYKDFVEDPASKGTILLAFGTFARWEFAPENVKDSVEGVLNSFPDYRFIFAGLKESNYTLGPHVLKASFVPQRALLNHPKTKMFISHGGLKSLKEAICSEVPILMMPILAEQNLNARIAKELGVAETIDKFTITRPQMKAKMQWVLNDPTTKNNVLRVKKMYLDTVIPSKDLVLNRVARYFKNTMSKAFIRKGMYTSWIQHFYSLETVAILVFVLVVTK